MDWIHFNEIYLILFLLYQCHPIPDLLLLQVIECLVTLIVLSSPLTHNSRRNQHLWSWLLCLDLDCFSCWVFPIHQWRAFLDLYLKTKVDHALSLFPIRISFSKSLHPTCHLSNGTVPNFIGVLEFEAIWNRGLTDYYISLLDHRIS